MAERLFGDRPTIQVHPARICNVYMQVNESIDLSEPSTFTVDLLLSVRHLQDELPSEFSASDSDSESDSSDDVDFDLFGWIGISRKGNGTGNIRRRPTVQHRSGADPALVSVGPANPHIRVEALSSGLHGISIAARDVAAELILVADAFAANEMEELQAEAARLRAEVAAVRAQMDTLKAAFEMTNAPPAEAHGTGESDRGGAVAELTLSQEVQSTVQGMLSALAVAHREEADAIRGQAAEDARTMAATVTEWEARVEVLAVALDRSCYVVKACIEGNRKEVQKLLEAATARTEQALARALQEETLAGALRTAEDMASKLNAAMAVMVPRARLEEVTLAQDTICRELRELRTELSAAVDAVAENHASDLTKLEQLLQEWVPRTELRRADEEKDLMQKALEDTLKALEHVEKLLDRIQRINPAVQLQRSQAQVIRLQTELRVMVPRAELERQIEECQLARLERQDLIERICKTSNRTVRVLQAADAQQAKISTIAPELQQIRREVEVLRTEMSNMVTKEEFDCMAAEYKRACKDKAMLERQLRDLVDVVDEELSKAAEDALNVNKVAEVLKSQSMDMMPAAELQRSKEELKKMQSKIEDMVPKVELSDKVDECNRALREKQNLMQQMAFMVPADELERSREDLTKLRDKIGQMVRKELAACIEACERARQDTRILLLHVEEAISITGSAAEETRSALQDIEKLQIEVVALSSELNISKAEVKQLQNEMVEMVPRHTLLSKEEECRRAFEEKAAAERQAADSVDAIRSDLNRVLEHASKLSDAALSMVPAAELRHARNEVANLQQAMADMVPRAQLENCAAELAKLQQAMAEMVPRAELNDRIGQCQIALQLNDALALRFEDVGCLVGELEAVTQSAAGILGIVEMLQGQLSSMVPAKELEQSRNELIMLKEKMCTLVPKSELEECQRAQKENQVLAEQVGSTAASALAEVDAAANGALWACQAIESIELELLILKTDLDRSHVEIGCLRAAMADMVPKHELVVKAEACRRAWEEKIESERRASEWADAMQSELNSLLESMAQMVPKQELEIKTEECRRAWEGWKEARRQFEALEGKLTENQLAYDAQQSQLLQSREIVSLTIAEIEEAAKRSCDILQLMTELHMAIYSLNSDLERSKKEICELVQAVKCMVDKESFEIAITQNEYAYQKLQRFCKELQAVEEAVAGAEKRCADLDQFVELLYVLVPRAEHIRARAEFERDEAQKQIKELDLQGAVTRDLLLQATEEIEARRVSEKVASFELQLCMDQLERVQQLFGCVVPEEDFAALQEKLEAVCGEREALEQLLEARSMRTVAEREATEARLVRCMQELAAARKQMGEMVPIEETEYLVAQMDKLRQRNAETGVLEPPLLGPVQKESCSLVCEKNDPVGVAELRPIPVVLEKKIEIIESPELLLGRVRTELASENRGTDSTGTQLQALLFGQGETEQRLNQPCDIRHMFTDVLGAVETEKYPQEIDLEYVENLQVQRMVPAAEPTRSQQGAAGLEQGTPCTVDKASLEKIAEILEGERHRLLNCVQLLEIQFTTTELKMIEGLMLQWEAVTELDLEESSKQPLKVASDTEQQEKDLSCRRDLKVTELLWQWAEDLGGLLVTESFDVGERHRGQRPGGFSNDNSAQQSATDSRCVGTEDEMYDPVAREQISEYMDRVSSELCTMVDGARRVSESAEMLLDIFREMVPIEHSQLSQVNASLLQQVMSYMASRVQLEEKALQLQQALQRAEVLVRRMQVSLRTLCRDIRVAAQLARISPSSISTEELRNVQEDPEKGDVLKPFINLSQEEECDFIDIQYHADKDKKINFNTPACLKVKDPMARGALEAVEWHQLYGFGFQEAVLSLNVSTELSLKPLVVALKNAMYELSAGLQLLRNTDEDLVKHCSDLATLEELLRGTVPSTPLFLAENGDATQPSICEYYDTIEESDATPIICMMEAVSPAETTPPALQAEAALDQAERQCPCKGEACDVPEMSTAPVAERPFELSAAAKAELDVRWLLCAVAECQEDAAMLQVGLECKTAATDAGASAELERGRAEVARLRLVIAALEEARASAVSPSEHVWSAARVWGSRLGR